MGRVVGRVWSTAKAESLSGHKLILVQPVKPDLTPAGRTVVCADACGAGAGELVYWCRGKESSFPFLPDEVPTDATIVGIVDEVHAC
ncbi:MAG: EutN/CcmL family microcompartment protein [Bryobacterales bacterium]|nr:EutN/CcmL family microcompartment protein [Bryobacterales bacterium]